MSATLYHFTARRFVSGIRKDGLTRGMVPVSLSPPRVVSGYQWLTSNPDFAQEWAEGTGRLPYRRDEVRIAVDVPAVEQYRLTGRLGWTLLTPLAADLCACGDPDHWYVFRGDVPPSWLRDITENPRASHPGEER
jgi:hypothetical protein